MTNKILSKFIGTLVLAIVFSNIAIWDFNVVRVYADTINYDYKESYDMVPAETSLKWYRKNSITVNPTKNPKLFKFNKKTNSYELNPTELPLDGKIYRYKDKKTGKEIFYKVLSFKASDKKTNVYEIEVQRAVYDGSKFIIDNKSIIFEEKNPLKYIYLKFLGKVGSSDKSTPKPETTELEKIAPEVPYSEITEPEQIIPETSLPEVSEPEQIVPEAPHSEISEPEQTVPETPHPEISKPEQIVPEAPLPEVSESEQIVPEAPLSEISEAPKVVPEASIPEESDPEKLDTSMIITRLGGATRIETALEIADEFRGGSKLEAIILSSANNFPDSLSGAVLTKKYGAPILLVNKIANRSKVTLDYIIKNVNTSGQVVILGSSGVIDDSIIEYLKNFGFTKIKRLGGSNRFGTNVAIIRDLAPVKGSEIIISSAVIFPDALSISSISAIKGIPIILTNKNSLSSEVKALLASIEPSKIYITGEVGAITNKVKDELKKYSSEIVRLGGYDRYETSIAINNYFKSDLYGDSIILTSGLNFPDALAGISLASKYNTPILLVNPSNSNVQKYFISNNKRKNIYVLGSTGVFSKELLNYIIQ